MREVGKEEKRDTERCEERRTERQRERENEGRSRKLRRHNKTEKGGCIGAIEEKRRTIGSDAGW